LLCATTLLGRGMTMVVSCGLPKKLWVDFCRSFSHENYVLFLSKTLKFFGPIINIYYVLRTLCEGMAAPTLFFTVITVRETEVAMCSLKITFRYSGSEQNPSRTTALCPSNNRLKPPIVLQSIHFTKKRIMMKDDLTVN
jgi:hypothetical protein